MPLRCSHIACWGVRSWPDWIVRMELYRLDSVWERPRYVRQADQHIARKAVRIREWSWDLMPRPASLLEKDPFFFPTPRASWTRRSPSLFFFCNTPIWLSPNSLEPSRLLKSHVASDPPRLGIQAAK